jgi:hypothetical protein
MYGRVFSALEWAFPMNAYPIKPTPISGVELKSTLHGDRLARILASVTPFRSGIAVFGLLVALCGMAPGVAAQESGPAAVVSAYTAALHAHDVPAALALFDQYGSATDARGRHFEGQAGLTEFLLGSGFSSPDARITTERLHVVANRAVWTYTCSCATGSTEVRLVVNHDRISVFAMVPPPSVLSPRADVGLLPAVFGRGPWPVGLLAGVIVLGLAAGALATRGVLRGRAAATPRRPVEGRLLAELAQARQRRAPSR